MKGLILGMIKEFQTTILTEHKSFLTPVQVKDKVEKTMALQIAKYLIESKAIEITTHFDTMFGSDAHIGKISLNVKDE